jgi:hypothetical protein
MKEELTPREIATIIEVLEYAKSGEDFPDERCEEFNIIIDKLRGEDE